jgi:UDP-N-acetyl-D-mannosaminuronic acid dehydrogenase
MPYEMGRWAVDVVVIGGCGHVGLPLGIALADQGLRTIAYDLSDEAVKATNDGLLPFNEPGAMPMLQQVLTNGMFRATAHPAVVAEAEHLIVVIGTPVDEHLNPDPRTIPRALGLCAEHFCDGQILILRSTVYPGVTALVEQMVRALGKNIDVAFCPERIAEGHSMVELYELPQIVAGRTERSRTRAACLFRHLTDEIVELQPEEAELAKLFTNAWRYIKFATANQLYMMANDFGLDYERIRQAIVYKYPRAQDLPGAGFAAGPCLFKDTMQLAAFNNNQFHLGHAAMLVNEGLPLYLVARLEQRYDLSAMTIGILGMAFKAESDDIRSSLAYKLKRILEFKAKAVRCTDPYVTVDPSLEPLEDVLSGADLLIIAAPHMAYAQLETALPVIDIWNRLGRGVRV